MIAIIGGGITGLTLALELERQGVDYTVFEATDRVGGVIRSGEVDGHLLEWGPQRARLTPTLRNLVKKLSLEQEVILAPPDLDLLIYRDGRLRAVPFSLRKLMSSDVVGSPAKLRLLLEPLTRGPRRGERVATYFARKLGREIYQTVVGPLFGGLYGSDPADMDVETSLNPLLKQAGVNRSLILRLLRTGGRISPAPACSFRKGMQTLPLALASTLGDRLHLETSVSHLEKSGWGWRVHFHNGTPVEASAVVVATNAQGAANVLRASEPKASVLIDELHHNALAIVHLEAETELRGMGFQVAFSKPAMALRGVTFNDCLFGRTGVYTAFLGGALHPQIRAMDEDAIGKLAVEQFRLTTTYEARVLSTENFRMPAWDITWQALAGLMLPDGLFVAGGWHSRPGLPGRLSEATQLAQKLTSVSGMPNRRLETVGPNG